MSISQPIHEKPKSICIGRPLRHPLGEMGGNRGRKRREKPLIKGLKNHRISLSAELTKKIETRGSSLASKCFCSSSSSLETSSPRPTKPSKRHSLDPMIPKLWMRIYALIHKLSSDSVAFIYSSSASASLSLSYSSPGHINPLRSGSRAPFVANSS
ncbi:hypothetical protein YC2023_001930 [Brassica napus]